MSFPSIKDIPSIAKPLKDARSLVALKRIMPFCRPLLKILGVDVESMDKVLNQASDLVQQIEEMSRVLERFNDLFASRGWIIYELLNLEVAKAAIAKAEAGDVDGAETDLVNYYSPERIRWKLQTMHGIRAFRSRVPLAQKALIDYEEERYYACVLVVLALLDGLVNELHERRRGFFSAEIDLSAWDSMSAHSQGLNVLANIFQTGRYTTTTDSITVPYRNGIMHGMDLSYDNKMVAAKTWGALFAVRDWALKAEAGLLEAPPEKPQATWTERLQQLRENQANKDKLTQWKPRNISAGVDIPQTGSPDVFADGTPERRLAEYLTFWQMKNYGYMARCLSVKLGPSAKQAPARIRQIFASKNLKSFEFQSVQDSTAAFSIIQTRLMFEEYGEEVTKMFDFRLINENVEGLPEVRGTSNSEWKIISWALY